MNQLGKRVFISYRGRDYTDAERLKRWLLQNQWCRSAVLFPRNSLSSEREILLTYEYFELMEVILDELSASQAFIFLDTPGYWSSYFTQIEVAQWRRFSPKNPPEAYQVTGVGRDGTPIFGQHVLLEPMASSQKSLFANISRGTNRRKQQRHRAPLTAWSRYAKTCFLICCSGCGEYILISQKVVYGTLKNHEAILCPHNRYHNNNNNQIRFGEDAKFGNFYRKPIIQKQEGQKEPRLLGIDEIIRILTSSEPPPTIPVITLEGETLRSELQTLGIFYAVGAGIITAGMLIANWLHRDE